MISRINKTQWQNIINNYFTNYNDNEATRIKRRNLRALYLSNNDYLQNKYLNNYTKQRIDLYNTWYIQNYNQKNNL